MSYNFPRVKNPWKVLVENKKHRVQCHSNAQKMKHLFTLIFLLCACLGTIAAQNSVVAVTQNATETTTTTTETPPNTHRNALYVDAGGGYFPQRDNASWAAQIGFGTKLNKQSALGIGGSYWGRVQTYKRSALGLGLHYRLSFWDNFIGKIEGGYILKQSMYDGVLGKDMIFVAESSRPFYYKMDLNVRFLKHYTVGFSACQSGNMFFKRFAGQKSETFDAWRINAFTLQLGVALNVKR